MLLIKDYAIKLNISFRRVALVYKVDMHTATSPYPNQLYHHPTLSLMVPF